MTQYFENIFFSAEDFIVENILAAEFVECRFNGIDFTSCNFSKLKFIDSEFNECNLSNSALRGATFRNCLFKKSKLIGLNWSEAANLVGGSFHESLLDFSVFHSMNLKSFSFENCKMHEVDFNESKLNKAVFCGSNLKGSTFNKADLSDADLRGAFDYFIDVRQTSVKKAKFSLPEALTLLTSLEIDINDP